MKPFFWSARKEFPLHLIYHLKIRQWFEKSTLFLGNLFESFTLFFVQLSRVTWDLFYNRNLITNSLNMILCWSIISYCICINYRKYIVLIYIQRMGSTIIDPSVKSENWYWFFSVLKLAQLFQFARSLRYTFLYHTSLNHLYASQKRTRKRTKNIFLRILL